MIRIAVVGMSRMLFGAAIATGMVAVLLAYLAYRLVRSLTAGRPALPVRDAAFSVMAAAAILAKAVASERAGHE